MQTICPTEIMECWSVSESYPMSNYYTKNETNEILQDNYYTKAEVDELISTSGEGVTRSEVQEMIDVTVNPIVEEVQRQAQAILNCYTKNEVNQLLEGYAKVENNTLIINEK